MDHPAEPKSATHAVDSPEPDRRDFLQKAACVVLGGAITAVPVAASVRVLINPVFQKTSAGVSVRIASVDGLAPGGDPQLFKVATDRHDAWTHYASREIGSIFLHRHGQGTAASDFVAFNAACPHLGCAVEYQGEQQRFFCPCHNSAFAKNGTLSDPKSPSPRGLDALKVEVRDGDVWVEFMNFRANIPEKVAIV